MSDAKVQSAIAHWAPRFVSNGVPLTDFEEVTAGVERWEDWCQAWSARAAVHEALGRRVLADGYRLSAGEHLTRAAVCYHFSKFVFVIDYEQMKQAHGKAVECRNLALPLLSPPGERVAIPYEGKQLYGILRKPKGVARPPVVVMCMGLDSTKEEMDANENVFLARGMATLAFDGPGQGEGEYDFAIRGDYEAAVRAVLDFLENRSDVDAGRAGLWGVSLGGYYAPRAAAFEQRVRRALRCRESSSGRNSSTVARATGYLRVANGPGPKRTQQAGGNTDPQGCREKHHLPAVHRRGQAGWYRAMAGRRAACCRRVGPGGALFHRGREPRRQQPRVPVSFPVCRLDGAATGRGGGLAG